MANQFDLAGARAAGYDDTAILEGVVKQNLRGFDLAGARAAGYDDTAILNGLYEQGAIERRQSLLERAQSAAMQAKDNIVGAVTEPFGRRAPEVVNDPVAAMREADDAVAARFRAQDPFFSPGGAAQAAMQLNAIKYAPAAPFRDGQALEWAERNRPEVMPEVRATGKAAADSSIAQGAASLDLALQRQDAENLAAAEAEKENPTTANIKSGLYSAYGGLSGAMAAVAANLSPSGEEGYSHKKLLEHSNLNKEWAKAIQTEASKKDFADAESKIGWMADQFLLNAPSTVTSLLSIFNPATAPYALGVMAAYSGGGHYTDLINAGVDGKIATLAAIGYGAVEAAIERAIPVEIGQEVLRRFKALPKLGQAQIGQRIVRGIAAGTAAGTGMVVTEGAEEGVTGLIQRSIDKAVREDALRKGQTSVAGRVGKEDVYDFREITNDVMGGIAGGAPVAGAVGAVGGREVVLSAEADIGRAMQQGVDSRDFAPLDRLAGAGPTEADYRQAVRSAFGGAAPVTAQPQPPRQPRLDPIKRDIDDIANMPSVQDEVAGVPQQSRRAPVQDESIDTTGMFDDMFQESAPKAQGATPQPGYQPPAWQGTGHQRPAWQGAPEVRDTVVINTDPLPVPQRTAPPQAEQARTEAQSATAPAAPAEPTASVVLQNRDRSQPESIAQMRGIAANPDPSRLSFSRDAANGAPVVFGDMPQSAVLGKADHIVSASGRKMAVQYAVVDAQDLIASNDVNGMPVADYVNGVGGKLRAVGGNGRVAGLQEAHRTNAAGNYTAGIIEDAGLHGVADIAGIRNPVLVRVMRSEDVTPTIGDEFNVRSNMGLSAVEQARTDAARVKLETLDFTDSGEITQDAIKAFVLSMPESERNELMDGGRVGRKAVDRMMAAIFLQAYGDAELVRIFAQAQDTESKAVITALAGAAPAMARLVDAGNLDIRSIVADAAKVAVNASREGVSLSKLAKQGDFELGYEVMAVVQFMADNIRKPRVIAEHLTDAANFAYGMANQSTADMFGGAVVSRDDVIRRVANDFQGRQENLANASGREPDASNAGDQAADEAGRGDNQAAEGFGLETQTEASLSEDDARKARIESERQRLQDQADAKARAEAERETVRQRSEAAAADFQLGQSAEDNLAGQGDIYGSNRDEAPAKRFETGATLTKEQRKTVLASLVDVYKQKNAEKETRINSHGDEYLAYPHQPELFEKSDITGAMVRYYVTLPDGRIAHPTELFPDYTQSEIETAVANQIAAERKTEDFKQSRIEALKRRMADTVADANRIFWKMQAGTSIQPDDTALLTDGTQYARTLKDSAERDAELLGDGWQVKESPTPLTKEADKESQPDTKQSAESKKIEVLKAQATGKITGDQADALKQLADAGETTAVDDVLKPEQTEQPAKIEDFGEKIGGAKTVETKETDTGTAMFSRKEPTTSREKLNAAIEKWSGVVDAFLDKTLDQTKQHVIFPSTPASMQVLGLPDLPVMIGKHALSYANIRLTVQEMKALPEMMADPQLVYLHEGQDGELSLNYVLDSGGYNGVNVVALKPNITGEGAVGVHYVATLLNVRPEVIAREVREGRAMYQGNVTVRGVKEAAQDAKRRSGRESAGLRELMSRKFGLSTTISKVMYRTDLVKLIDDGGAQFSRAEQPAFYSHLSRAIESAPDKVFTTATQFKLWLNSNAAKLGIKKDEVEWSGINDYLDMQGKGKVSRDDVVGFLSENAVKVEDVVLGVHAEKAVWGMPDWTGRSQGQSNRLRKSSAPEPSPDQDSPQSGRQFHERQSSKFEFTQDAPDRQPKNPVKVTYRKRRVYTNSDIDSLLRSAEDGSPTPGEALTDDRARQDIRALERAISNYYKGTKNAQGAYEAAPVPDDGLTIIARAFGARLRVFRVRGNGKDFGFFDGVHLSGNSDTVYVNESSTRPHLAVLGHELAHHLRTTNPALYARLVEQIKPYIREDRYAAWSKLWVEKGDKLQEEFVGEVLSDGFMNKTFWQAMAKKDRGLVRQIYTALVKLLQKAFGQYSPKTEAILSDYAEVMRIAGEVMAEAGIDARTALKIAGVDGSTLDTALSYSRADQRGASITNKQNVIPGFQATPATAPIIRQPPLGLPGGISGNQASWSATIDTAFDDFVYKYQNKHVDTKRVVQSIQAGGKMLADQWNAYLQEELYHGRAAGRVLEFVNQELEPLTKKMLMRGVTMAELDQYLLARHATEANALIASRDPGMPDGGSGMFDADAAAYFAGLDPQKRQRLDATAKEVDAMIEQTRQLYVDYGLESKDTIDGWRGMFDHYVPLKREDMDGGGTGLGQGFSIKGREAKHRTGSTSRKVVDILANIALQRESVIVRGEKNRVAASLIGMAKLNPNKDFWEVGKVPTERVLNNKTGLIETVPDHNYKNRDNVITAKVKMANGDVVEVAVVFNEKNDRAMRMAEALKNLDVVPLEGVVMPMFAMTTRWIASVNTQYNPVFGFVNLTRDVSGAVLNLNATPLKNHKRKVLWHTLPALHGIYSDVRADRNGHQGKTNWSNLWDEFKREGGITGYRDMYRNSADRARDIQRKLDPHAWMNSGLGKVFTAGGALKVPYKVAYPAAKWLFDWLSDFNLTMENAVRLASYKVATEQGMSKQQAASLAKNLTVNFNRKGQVAQQAGAMYAFFNASVQGTARIAETITTMDRPGDIKSLRVSRIGAAIVGGGVMLGVVQAVMLALAGFDDDDPPEFVRERNLIIPLKPLTGEKNYIAIPMPLGYHVFPNIGRLITEAAIYGKPGDRTLDLMGTVVSAFNPVGGGDIVSALAPSLADPVVDLLRNKDWTGKQIYREDFGGNETPGFTRTKDTASGYAKAISEWVNDWTGGTEYSPGKLSPTPDQIDYAISQVTGGVGREFGKASQTVGAMVSGEELPSHKIPLFGRFYGSSEGAAGQAARFYANLKEANRHDAEIKGRLRDNKPEDNYLDEHPEAYWMAESGNHVEAQVRRMRGMKRKMIKDGASRDEVREIDADIAAIMREYNADVAEIKAER